MTAKITVSLPDDQVAQLRAAVREGRAPSVSAAVSRALAQQAGHETLAGLLAHLDAVHGAVPAADVEWAASALRDA